MAAPLVALGLPPTAAAPPASPALPAKRPDQPALVIGRASEASIMNDTAERVMRTAFDQIGVQVEFRQFPMLRSLQLANEGETDGELVRIADVAGRYPNLIALSTPISRIDIGVFTTDPALARFPRAELARLRIGSTRGIFALAKHTQGLRVVEGQTLPSTFEMLRAGRFEVAIASYIDGVNAVRATPAFAGVIVSPHCWASEPLYFYLHRRHLALVAGLNQALRKMQQEGVIDRAMNKALQDAGIPPLDCNGASAASGALPGTPQR